jgi:Na+/H+ antiporter NhaD/arsenite permease-like protein
MLENLEGAGFVLKNPWAAVIIFVLTFIMISFRKMKLLPIGRPSAALFGAVLMVIFGVMTPEEAYALVNWDTICLLLGMMIIAEHLRAARFFDNFSTLFEKINSPFMLLTMISVFGALASSILVNDPVCVVMTPMVLEICRRKGLNPFPYLVVLATSSNIGSALTLTGNPQNMIIGSISKLNFMKFVYVMLLPFFICMVINLALAALYYKKELVLPETSDNAEAYSKLKAESNENQEILRSKRIGFFSLTIACIGFVAGYSMAFSALTSAVVVILFHRKDPSNLLSKIDWSLLLFFSALFVVIGGLQTSGLSYLLTSKSLELISGTLSEQIWKFSGITLIGANLLSNVPFVLLAAPSIQAMDNPELFWYVLAFVSTVAGNLTIFGSVANMIVAEGAGDNCKIGFWAFAKFGALSAILCILAGVAILLA